MEVEEFVKRVRQAKMGIYSTRPKDLKVMVNPDRTVQQLYTVNECDKCGHIDKKGVEVIFRKTPDRLSVFEAELLYILYCLNRKPYDYGGFHKCVAGKEFIENIESVRVL